MINTKDILSGWKNLISPTKESKEKVLERLSICASCDKSSMGLFNLYPHCTVCGCFIPAKISSTKTKGCPEKKWK